MAAGSELLALGATDALQQTAQREQTFRLILVPAGAFIGHPPQALCRHGCRQVEETFMCFVWRNTAICWLPLIQNCRYYEDATVAWICILIEVGECCCWAGEKAWWFANEVGESCCWAGGKALVLLLGRRKSLGAVAGRPEKPWCCCAIVAPMPADVVGSGTRLVVCRGAGMPVVLPRQLMLSSELARSGPGIGRSRVASLPADVCAACTARLLPSDCAPLPKCPAPHIPCCFQASVP